MEQQNDTQENIYVLELAKHIKTSDNKADEDGGQLDIFLPEFLLILRDFSLDLEVGGKKVTAKEYLENCLKTNKDSLKETNAFKEPRLILRKYFKRRNCFPICVPACGTKLNKLDSLKREELAPEFVEAIRQFRDYVMQQTEPFQTAAGHEINGRVFATLAEKYVEAISNGAVPCIDMTMKAMVKTENVYVVSMAVEEYNKEMDMIELPTAMEAAIFEAHKSAKAAALQIYQKHCVMDKDSRTKEIMDTMICGTFSKTKVENEKLSSDGCLEKIKELHTPIAKCFEEEKYFVEGGLSIYEQDIQRMIQTYNECETIGFMKDQVRLRYLQDIETEKNTVLQKDKLIKKEEKQRKLADDDQKMKEENTRIATLAEERAEREKEDLQVEKRLENKWKQRKLKEDIIKEKERYDNIIRYKEDEIEQLRQEGLDEERRQAECDMKRTRELRAKNCIIS